MRLFQRLGGGVLLVLWGLAPALHLQHIVEHHMPSHSGEHGCSHHAHHSSESQEKEGTAGVAASDACDLCDWQWAPADEGTPFLSISFGKPHCVEGKLGRTSPALKDNLANSDRYRRGPPEGISIV
jgi:hypothetical protein